MAGCGRGFCGCHPPRKRLLICMLLLLSGTLCTIGFVTFGYAQLPREYPVESQVAEMQTHLKFLESLYRSRQEDIINMQHKLGSTTVNASQQTTLTGFETTLTPEVSALLTNNSDSMVSRGLRCKELTLMKSVFVFHLLPYLMNDPASLRPAFHMKGHSGYVKTVIGIPTVQRDKENYLMTTLKYLIQGMSDVDFKNSLIIIFVGETDLQFVIKTAQEIEAVYPTHVKNGYIELLSPNPSYYPNFTAIPPTLGDSPKRVKWRTKQNLDTLYLMAYGQSRGTFYLMIEDDVIAKDNFLKEIGQFTAAISVSTPNWFFIEYCGVGGIGKLFKSSELVHFITYVQLFYSNMPIDWLLESYLADRVCTIDKTSASCGKNKMAIRPKYKESLFQHIGLFSSLKGKMQKVKDTHFSNRMSNYYPHKNPKTQNIICTIRAQADYSIEDVYSGRNYFWGIDPKPGDVIEFWFTEPIDLASYQFRSGNIIHPTDNLKDTVVEIYPHGREEFVTIDSFDEFGLAEGSIDRIYGSIEGIRLRLKSTIHHWIVLSEVELKTFEQRREE